MRRAVIPFLLIAASTAAGQTSAPAKPALSSDSLTLGDYCTIILAPKVQDALTATDAQRAAFAKERDRFELMISNLAGRAGGRGATTLLGVARRGLEVEGQRLRDLLTSDQDTAFQNFFSQKSLKPIQIEVASSAPHAGPNQDTFGEIKLIYTHYKEPDTTAAVPAPPAPSAPAAAPAAKPAAAPAPTPAVAGPAGTFDAHAQPLDATMAADVQFVLSHKYYQFAPIRVGAFAKQNFEDLPTGAGLLVGLRCTTPATGASVASVQPIYLTASGEVLGAVHGTPGPTSVDLVAKPGYAVGELQLTGGGGLDSLTVTFMHIKGELLDPSDGYNSSKLGGKADRSITVGGDGTPIIGIIGRTQPNSPYIALSVISLPTVADPATIK